VFGVLQYLFSERFAARIEAAVVLAKCEVGRVVFPKTLICKSRAGIDASR
jgi:hypothetical protein